LRESTTHMRGTRIARLFWGGVFIPSVGIAALVLYLMLGPEHGLPASLGLLMGLWLSSIIGIAVLVGISLFLGAVSVLHSHSAWEQELER